MSRRAIDKELCAESLTPIASMVDRLHAWKLISQERNEHWELDYQHIDIANEYDKLVDLLVNEKPHSIIHFAEQRSAPYSMKNSNNKIYTVRNNLSGTTAVLCAIVDVDPNIHLIHLGTMGVYGYGTFPGIKIPEGYLNVLARNEEGDLNEVKILHPANPGSIYHMTKTQDHLLFQFYAKNDQLKITDLHQGIVWGTFTEETTFHPDLVNRFDWDGDYGTVLNRFIMQAAVNHPLTVYGTGGQTRAFIHIRDAIRCFELSLENPPKRGDPVLIRNQVTETHKVRELANLVVRVSGNATINYLPNPRKEAAENELFVDNSSFLDLNLQVTKLEDGLVSEVMELAKSFKARVENALDKILPSSQWVQQGSKVTSPVSLNDRQ